GRGARVPGRGSPDRWRGALAGACCALLCCGHGGRAPPRRRGIDRTGLRDNRTACPGHGSPGSPNSSLSLTVGGGASSAADKKRPAPAREMARSVGQEFGIEGEALSLRARPRLPRRMKKARGGLPPGLRRTFRSCALYTRIVLHTQAVYFLNDAISFLTQCLGVNRVCRMG